MFSVSQRVRQKALAGVARHAALVPLRSALATQSTVTAVPVRPFAAAANETDIAGEDEAGSARQNNQAAFMRTPLDVEWLQKVPENYKAKPLTAPGTPGPSPVAQLYDDDPNYNA